MVRKKMIYKIIKYGIILIVWIVVLKLAFHDFKPEYLISWNAFSNWWIDTYAGLFKMILSIICKHSANPVFPPLKVLPSFA